MAYDKALVKSLFTEFLRNNIFDEVLLNQLVDALDYTNPPYKVYTALVSQSGTNAPVAKILQNTFIGEIVWTYIGVGTYHGTLTGAFTSEKTWSIIESAVGSACYDCTRIDANSVLIDTNGNNDQLNFTSLEIRVYA